MGVYSVGALRSLRVAQRVQLVGHLLVPPPEVGVRRRLCEALLQLWNLFGRRLEPLLHQPDQPAHHARLVLELGHLLVLALLLLCRARRRRVAAEPVGHEQRPSQVLLHLVQPVQIADALDRRLHRRRARDALGRHLDLQRGSLVPQQRADPPAQRYRDRRARLSRWGCGLALPLLCRAAEEPAQPWPRRRRNLPNLEGEQPLHEGARPRHQPRLRVRKVRSHL
mmetsp:Transcript_25525/g.83716  ORF Transcript_25525/g.83716 Transcript_25525/m.83716 type:complete len:224 (-) Transcript_25525:2502-3173(-)